MKKIFALLFVILVSFNSKATIHTIQVWNGYMQFLPSSLTIQLGDTIQWLPLDPPTMFHTVTSTSIPTGAITFNQTWQLPADTFFQYIPQVAGVYAYECTPHVTMGMIGVFTVNSSSVAGCTDSIALNYNPLATIDDSSCVYPLIPLNYEDLFFSEYGEGSSNNKYFEIFNPSNDTVSLTNYFFARTVNAPTTVGVYEYWNAFDSGAVILPNDVYVVAHTAADPLILNSADMTFGSFSNGDDGLALVYGNEPNSPIAPDGITYAILDWVGDWNGDPGTGWNVAGVTNATANHTLIRKCSQTQGDTSWINAAGTSVSNSSWLVKPSNYWNSLGMHSMGVSTSTASYTLCAGGSISVGSSNYYVSGTYIDTLLSAIACDSIVTTNLIVLPAITYTNNQSICAGNSIMVGPNVYNASGTYIDTLLSSMSCDSIVVTNLVVGATVNITNNYTLCAGDSIIVNANVYNISGVYIDTLLSTVACDSIITTNLTIAPNYSITNTLTICSGEVVTIGSNTYDSSGVYIDVLISSALCDSTVTTILTVLPAITSVNNYTLCVGDSLLIGNIIYTNSGTYTNTFTAASGCDSISTINLDYYQQLPLNIISVPNPPEICLGDTILLEASAGFISYSWNVGGSSHVLYDTPTTDTWYMVEALDSNACISYEDIHVYVDSCITGSNQQPLIITKVYPNPATDQLIINFGLHNEEINMKVFSLTGELMTEEIIGVEQTSTQLIIAEWSAAVYSIYLSQANGSIKTKTFTIIR